MRSNVGAALAAAAIATTLAPNASADPGRAAVDWGKLLVQLDRAARTGAERPGAAGGSGGRLERTSDPYPQNQGNAWFGVAPRVALVARDWASAYKLAGDRLSLVDAMRLSASTRMIVTRVRLSDTRVTPFAQLGLGQWRVDRNLLPLTPRSIEIAGQFGGGVELNLGKGWQLAYESTVTAIYREAREANSLPQTRMWSAMLAARAEF